LKAQGVTRGGVAWLKTDARYAYYMVTKDKYWQKQTNENVWEYLLRLKALCIDHQVKHLAMPIIACGLDALNWDVVKKMVQVVFQSIEIQITVYIWDCKKINI